MKQKVAGERREKQRTTNRSRERQSDGNVKIVFKKIFTWQKL